MFTKFSNFFSTSIGIDLGTTSTLIYVKHSGIVLNEPSVVAFTTRHGRREVLAVGDNAKLMLGRSPGHIQMIRPLRSGVISDSEIGEEMLKYFINRARKGTRLMSPEVLVCVPSGSTPVERNTIRSATEAAGARRVYLIEEPMAAAIGARLPVTEPRGSMVVDIGGGTTEVAVLSLSGIAYSTSIRIGGDTVDEAIIEYIRREMNLLIGENTAERIKKEIGSATITNTTPNKVMEIKGRDAISGVPKQISIDNIQVSESITEPINRIIQAVQNTLQETPPELSSDLVDKGIVLTGGGALLGNIDQILHERIGLPVSIAEDPLSCVVLGIGKILEDMENLGTVLGND